MAKKISQARHFMAAMLESDPAKRDAHIENAARAGMGMAIEPPAAEKPAPAFVPGQRFFAASAALYAGAADRGAKAEKEAAEWEVIRNFLKPKAAEPMPAAKPAKAGYHGPRGKAGEGKRASIKRDWLSNPCTDDAAGYAMLAAAHDSTGSSARSIIGDLRATMRQANLSAAFVALAGKAKPNPALDLINRDLIADPQISTDALMARLDRAGIVARKDFVAGSLSAARESLMILREAGALADADHSAMIVAAIAA